MYIIVYIYIDIIDIHYTKLYINICTKHACESTIVYNELYIHTHYVYIYIHTRCVYIYMPPQHNRSVLTIVYLIYLNLPYLPLGYILQVSRSGVQDSAGQHWPLHEISLLTAGMSNPWQNQSAKRNDLPFRPKDPKGY